MFLGILKICSPRCIGKKMWQDLHLVSQSRRLSINEKIYGVTPGGILANKVFECAVFKYN